MTRMRRIQAGFTQIELMLVIAIIGILASVAIAEMRDYSRRATISEVVLAVNSCKTVISENYQVLEDAPAAGAWGCETGSVASKYAGTVQTSANGVIRVAVNNLDGLVNGHHVYLVPMRADGQTPLVTPNDLGGRGVRHWLCGSDWNPVRKALPSNCRSDTTEFASQEFN